MADFPLIVVPGDEPRQVRGSAALERLRAYGEVVVYDKRPADEAEKIEIISGKEMGPSDADPSERNGADDRQWKDEALE